VSLYYDPITLEVMRNAFQSIAEEMGAALIRTALSTNIKDRKDCSTAIYTVKGDLVAQAEHIPLHLGVMQSIVKDVLKINPVENMEPGDALITNDPYISGSHLPDICMISPVFFDNKCVALIANIAHHVDIGGIAPGGMPANSTEIFQEGIRIPPIKLRKKGEIDEQILALITNNVRTSYETYGDFQAQFSAVNVGEKRLVELIKKYGADLVLTYMEEIINYSERRMRKMIGELPQGIYSFEDYLEGDGITFPEQNIKISVLVEIKDDNILVDFSGTDPQVQGSVNCTRSVTLACVYFAVKSAIDPEAPSNEGACRPIKVETPLGTLVNPIFPAPVSNANINTSQRIADVVLGALAKAIPEKVPAASTGSMSLFTIGGIDPRTNEYYSYVETYGGGQGAMFNQDGMDGVHTNMTNTRNTPVEVIEISYPLRVEKYGLIPDSDGPGKFRGGLGIVREITVLDHTATVTFSTERRKIRPWGLMGGKPGAPSDCFMISKDGKKQTLPSKITTKVESGTRLILKTAGGGGFGNPLERDSERIYQDIKEEIITIKKAKEEYGLDKRTKGRDKY